MGQAEQHWRGPLGKVGMLSSFEHGIASQYGQHFEDLSQRPFIDNLPQTE